MGGNSVIETPRLKLIAGTEGIAAAEMDGAPALARVLGAAVPETWPPDAVRDALCHFLMLCHDHPEWEGWLTWYAIRVDAGAPKLCGSIGFRGPPDERGMIEIGYSVLPEYQGSGFATEMVAGLVRWAVCQPGVRIIEAETDFDNPASIRVLEKNAFVRVGEGSEPGAIRFFRSC